MYIYILNTCNYSGIRIRYMIFIAGTWNALIKVLIIFVLIYVYTRGFFKHFTLIFSDCFKFLTNINISNFLPFLLFLINESSI